MMKKGALLICFMTLVNTLAFSQGIPKRGFGVDWIYPKAMTNPTILSYERIELGVHLPDSLEQKINNFLKREGEQLNPFNPQDIDIKISFSIRKGDQWKEVDFCYAFFYEEFNRNTKSTNPDEWNWSKLKTHDRFRFRFTPDQEGLWRFNVQVKVKGIELVNMGPYEFVCKNSFAPGYVKVSDNRRYLKLGENTFMPIGQNLPKPTCYYKKDASGKVIQDDYGCSECVCSGIEEWCPHLKNLPMNPKGYMVYLEELEKLRNAGGNYVRMLIFPHTYEIEYDRIGDYSSRMNVAWELDRFFEKTEELDLKVQLNLFLGYPFTKAQYGVDVWDWYADSDKDKGYCYRHDLGLKEPSEFLTNERAKQYYKNRLRYIISRWGYSTSLAVMELVSEINNKFRDNPKEVYRWQKEMIDYIKEDLGHDQHLIAVNYYKPPKRRDKSYRIKNVDIVTVNEHEVRNSRLSLQEAYKELESYDKPVIFSEVGTGDSDIDKCDQQTEWMKDLWMTIFSGTATVGLNWNEDHNYALWRNFHKVNAYTFDINFDEYDQVEGRQRKDGFAEVLALKSSDKTKSIGIIQNLTWNYYTNGTGEKCRNEHLLSEKYQTFVVLSAGKENNVLHLKKMNRDKIYMIEWFDPFSETKLAVEEIASDAKGNIILKHPDLTKEMPFVTYKLYEKGEKFNTLKPSVQRIKPQKIPEKELPAM